MQLRTESWIWAIRNGKELADPYAPTDAWWDADPPSEQRIHQSPLRFLRLCSPATGIDDELRQLAGVKTIDGADVETLAKLLRDLRDQLKQRQLPEDPNSSGTARQAFVGLHRIVYGRLAEAAADQDNEIASILKPVGLLCDLGGSLVYRPANEARHDNGRYAPYVRHFVGQIPFVVLPRDRDDLADRLGVATFTVGIERVGQEEGQDVTDDVSPLLGARHAELLAILVHHSLGSQTLTPGSQPFETRSRVRAEGPTGPGSGHRRHRRGDASPGTDRRAVGPEPLSRRRDDR